MDDIDLSHLAPCTVRYDVPANPKRNIQARSYLVEVAYSDHCYTKNDGSGDRVFDPRRYELSKTLPAIIADLLNRRCSFAFGVNFLTIEDVAPGEDYEIYFEVFKRKETKSLGLIVRSAYIRDKNRLAARPPIDPVRFSTILYNVMNEKMLHRR